MKRIVKDVLLWSCSTRGMHARVPTTGIPKTSIGAEVAESSMDMIQI